MINFKNFVKELFSNAIKHKAHEVSIHIDDDDSIVSFIAFVNDMWVCKMICVKEDKQILISDIQPRDYDNKLKINKYINKGYASVLMSELIEYASANGFERLHGNLSKVDWNHKDRLHHFYKKFGFKILLHENPQDCYYGEIVKELHTEELK